MRGIVTGASRGLGLALTRCRHEPDPEARLLLGAAFAPVGALLLLYFVGGGLTASTPFGSKPGSTC